MSNLDKIFPYSSNKSSFKLLFKRVLPLIPKYISKTFKTSSTQTNNDILYKVLYYK